MGMRLVPPLLALVALLNEPLVAEAQPTRNVRTIGFLGPPPSAGGLVQAFQQGLRDLGYVEGQNIRGEYRYTDVPLQGNLDRMAQLAAELVRLKPDVLVVSIAEAALAAKNATSTIPIVMANVPDPVAAGLVSSLARPGGNVTGLSRQGPELIGKNFQLLKEAVPETTRVGVLANPRNPLNSVMVSATRDGVFNAARRNLSLTGELEGKPTPNGRNPVRPPSDASPEPTAPASRRSKRDHSAAFSDGPQHPLPVQVGVTKTPPAP